MAYARATNTKRQAEWSAERVELRGWYMATNTFLIMHAFKLIMLNIMAPGNLPIMKVSPISSVIALMY